MVVKSKFLSVNSYQLTTKALAGASPILSFQAVAEDRVAGKYTVSTGSQNPDMAAIPRSPWFDSAHHRRDFLPLSAWILGRSQVTTSRGHQVTSLIERANPVKWLHSYGAGAQTRKRVNATQDKSPDMAVKKGDNHGTHTGILSLILSIIMLVKPTLVSAQAAQSQGPVKEPQKVEVSQNVQKPAGDKRTTVALLQAIANNDVEKTQEILSQGFDVNVNFYGINFLNFSINKEYKEIISLLLKYGASVDLRDDNGHAALYYAVTAGDKEIISLLLKYGADINETDKQGLTLVHRAVMRGQKDALQILLAKEADAEVRDSAGRTPLSYAARASFESNDHGIDVVKLLLAKGVSINTQDKWGYSPLHYSVLMRNKALVEFFVSKGADCEVFNDRGYTPYLLARELIYFFEKQYIPTKNYEPQEVKRLELDKFNFLSQKEFLAIQRNERIKQLNEIANILRKGKSIYYVATDGKDSNPGTLAYPFKSIDVATDIAKPGDVILVRGGVYPCLRTIHLDKSGEYSKPIRLQAFSEDRPILDFSEARGDAIFITGAYWHLKGLVITRGEHPVNVMGSEAHHNVLEQITVFDNGAVGIQLRDGPGYNIVLNCDSYRNFDPQYNGQNTDGFICSFFLSEGNILMGNRAWNNADDGFDLWLAGNSVRLERCYAWRNGEDIWNHPGFIGNGNGFKLGKGLGKHVLIGCVSWDHYFGGFNLNGHFSGIILYNCTAIRNSPNYYFHSGFEGSKDSILRNNIAMIEGEKNQIVLVADSQNNSWDADLGLTLTDDDFVSLDDSMMSSPRNPDGSIPQNNFLKLSPASAAIDKGTDIGIPFVGQRPDLGAFEYDPNAPDQGYVKMLHQAVRDRDIAKIKELLAQGEGINDKDWLGYTPIQWAVYFGYPDVVELLISQGADPDIQSDTGRFTLEIARAMVYADIEALLNKHKAVKEAPTAAEKDPPDVKEGDTQGKAGADPNSQSPDMAAAQVIRHTSTGYMTEYRVFRIEYPDNSTHSAFRPAFGEISPSTADISHTAYKVTEELFGLRGQKG
jgi:ankyrin repeat protein